MKEGWKTVKLGEVCEKITDGSHNPPKGIEHSNYFMLSSQNVQDGYLLMDSVRYLSKEDFELENKRTKAQKGDILLTIVGTIGRTCVLTGNEGNITFQRSVALMKPIKAINSYYLMYYFLYQNKDLNLKANGAAQKGIYLKQLIQYPVILPPLEEQHRIVSILDASFEKIDALKKNAEENLKNAKALFQQVLAQELEPKEGWVEKKLGEVCNKIVDGTHHSPTNTPEGEYPYITAKNIKHNGIDLSNITYVTRDIHREIYSRCNPEKGDVLMIKDGATTGIAVVNDLDFEFSLLSSVALLKTKMEILDSYYLCYVLNSPDVYNQFRSKMDGAAITRITLVKIKDAVIQVPPLDQQRKIVRTLDTLSEKCRRLEQVAQQTICECDALKQSILRQAFSGEL